LFGPPNWSVFGVDPTEYLILQRGKKLSAP